MYDSIVNVAEFLSDHWLEEAFPTRLTSLNRSWTDTQRAGGISRLKALAAVSQPYSRLRADLPRQRSPEYRDAVTALNVVLLDAMGFDASPRTLHTFQADTEIDVPLLLRVQRDGREALHVLQADLVASDDDLLSDDGVLLEPIVVDPRKERPACIGTVADGITMLLLVEDAPRYVLVMAGTMALLTDAPRWAEGRYLAFDIDTALARRDTRATGELAWHAGLWSADVLLPAGSGESAVIEDFSADSVKHAVGVSEDLREGLRRSVELIGNEVLAQRRARGLPVEGLDELPGEITAQSLRFLYRILFLLFAEARPELGILPVGAPEYGAGYGIDRLRELVQVPLSPQSQAGHHFHDSLDLLFRLVNDGHGTDRSAGDGLVFEPLAADLFSADRAYLIDSIRLSNQVLQQVLEMLLLSRATSAKGRTRGYVSYAQLGINQLGAVYEGLMAYTGFIADRPLAELARDGDPAKGTWLVPAEDAGGFDPASHVTRIDRDGRSHLVVHPQGSYVYRLAGRDRERSASFYTPEILTRTVVRHALAELLTDDTTAAEILDLRVVEPALGSGAFANEAINQLASEYLLRRQKETGRTIDPAAYQEELQRAKAFIALHRVYGVDLNATAVELAEVSMWLNVMHPGLQAPWFGLHLRRGNSLIGARRATYNLASTPLRRTWHTTVPKDRPLTGEPLGPNEVHHFLLPAAGWGAAADTKEAKELAKDDAARLRTWAKSTRAALGPAHVKRLIGLAQRTERLWALTRRRMEISEFEIARTVDVWGHPAPQVAGEVPRAEVESALADPDSPYQRLRLAMDAWCALTFWPLDDAPLPPTMDQWLSALEDLLGIQGKAAPAGQTAFHDLPTSFIGLGDLDESERLWHGMRPVADILASTPWLATARQIAQREGFFHWELDFAQVFARGGFDLAVGNPPWVRPTWQEPTVLAEQDPWFGLADLKSLDKKQYAARRAAQITIPGGRRDYLTALVSNAAVVRAVTDSATYPQLAGAANLYRNFIALTGRLLAPGGIAGLLHPDDHLMHDKSAPLREWVYPRLRRRWAFVNEMQLFQEPSHTEEFGISVYGAPRPVDFLQACGLYHPVTLEASLFHDGSGPVPGLQLPTGGWDLRPHRSRIVHVDQATLAEWAAILEEPGTSPLRTRALNPVVREVADALGVLARQPRRMAGRYEWTRCWDEDVIKRSDGVARWDNTRPEELIGLILQPSHFSILNPLAKEPPEGATGATTFEAIDLAGVEATLIPRTNYTLKPEVLKGGGNSRYLTEIRRWDERPVIDFWRLAWRRRLGQNMARTLHAALIPPGPGHVHTVHSLRMSSDRETALVGGLWAALPYDFLVKVLNVGDMPASVVDVFALPESSAAEPPILTRVLRLNALTVPYADLVEQVWEPVMATDDWTAPFSHLPPLRIPSAAWDETFPLRTDEARRAALVELDALVALALGMSADQLVAIYDSQFPVLRKYESGTWFDASGQLIARHHQQAGIQQQKDDFRNLTAYLDGEDCGDLLDRYTAPFRKADREAETRAAYADFQRRLGL